MAQDTRCPAVGKRLISNPISAMMTCAAIGPIAGDLVEALRGGQPVAATVGRDRRRGGGLAGVARAGCGDCTAGLLVSAL